MPWAVGRRGFPLGHRCERRNPHGPDWGWWVSGLCFVCFHAPKARHERTQISFWRPRVVTRQSNLALRGFSERSPQNAGAHPVHTHCHAERPSGSGQAQAAAPQGKLPPSLRRAASCVWLRANLVANNLRLLLLSPPTAIALTVSVTCVPQLPQTNGAQEIGMRAEGPLAEKGHIWGGGPTLWQSMPLTLAPPRVNTPSLPPPS